MKIFDNIEILDLGLLYKDNFIISDLHLGFEEALNKQGILIPRFQFEDLFKRLKKILDKIKIKRIIINGDFKHEFGVVSDQEWRDCLKLIDFLSEYGEVVLIRGNHDSILEPIAKKRDVEVVNFFKIDKVCITHGNEVLEKVDFDTLIIGHDHPIVGLRVGRRVEKYKCFLKGKWKKKDLIMMPSFNLLVEGSDVMKERLLSPYLDRNVDNFEVFVIEDKVYKFGKVKDLE